MKKIINALIIIGYLWLSLITLYNTVLPQQYKDLVPQFTNLPFLLSATFAGVLSSALLYMKQFTNKQGKVQVETLIAFNEKLKDRDSTIFKMEAMIYSQNSNINSLNELKTKENAKQDIIVKRLERSIELAELELASRLTNPLIDTNIKERINKVLDNEE